MKRLFVCITLALLFSSCNIQDLPAQWESERYLKATLIAPSTYKKVSFSKINEVTVKDEIDELEQFFKEQEEKYEWRAKSILALDAEKEIYESMKEKHSLAEGLYELYAGRLDSVVRYDYRLVYEASNQYGVPVRGTFDTRFTTAGYIVGARMGFDYWTAIGNLYALPESRELLKIK